MPRKELPEAWADFTKTLREAWEPPLLRLMWWLDRQLRRSPRLYRWLSR
jgi:hypothetical protein